MSAETPGRTEETRAARPVQDHLDDPPIPILSPEQYRFLRFLLDLADELAGRSGSLGISANQPSSQRGLCRIRAAVRLFEKSPSSPGRTGRTQ